NAAGAVTRTHGRILIEQPPVRGGAIRRVGTGPCIEGRPGNRDANATGTGALSEGFRVLEMHNGSSPLARAGAATIWKDQRDAFARSPTAYANVCALG